MTSTYGYTNLFYCEYFEDAFATPKANGIGYMNMSEENVLLYKFAKVLPYLSWTKRFPVDHQIH